MANEWMKTAVVCMRTSSCSLAADKPTTYIAALRFEDVDEARDEGGVDGGCGDADGGAEGEDLRLR